LSNYYKINTPLTDNHDKLIALPLTIITIFCFSFVLMHPSAVPHKQASAADGTGLTTNRQGELSPIHVTSPSTLTKLSADSYNDQTQGSSAGSSKGKSSSANDLQSANQNNHGQDQSLIIHINKSINQTLENLSR
jgi:hypothetical protein